MKRFALRVRVTVKADVDAAASHIATGSIEQALRLYDAFDATIIAIRKNPHAGSIFDLVDHPSLKGVRRRAIIGFEKHFVFYIVNAETVEVLCVVHGARDLPRILNEIDDVFE